ncbi:hypothetical protein AB0J86_02000 [Micromonospora sp. NPDC049559]|uniref:hypothetical protein n=1 Tax=Micromonospora sp. NPDC049559 TaxID=3155923 RepID=UPI00342A7646
MSLVAVVTSFAMTTTAQAAPLFTIKTTDDNPGGTLSFTAYGDIVTICDVQADGKPAVGTVWTTGGVQLYTFMASGNGTCNTRRASDGGVFDLVEGREYGFEVCLQNDNGTWSFCRTNWAFNNN